MVVGLIVVWSCENERSGENEGNFSVIGKGQWKVTQKVQPTQRESHNRKRSHLYNDLCSKQGN
jgi:hypothetical protein